MEYLQTVYREAFTLFKNKDYEPAIDKFDEALKLDPQNKLAKRYRQLSSNLLAKKYLKEGYRAGQSADWPTAIQRFRKALRFLPQHTGARKALANAERVTRSDAVPAAAPTSRARAARSSRSARSRAVSRWGSDSASAPARSWRAAAGQRPPA